VKSFHLKSAIFFAFCVFVSSDTAAWDVVIVNDEQQMRIETPEIEAAISKQGYVTGIRRQSFLDKQTGFRDVGFGLDIADWIMEPGSDRGYRDELDEELIYRYENLYHGSRAKRSIEGPQICTQAKQIEPHLIASDDFIAVRQQFRYRTAAPGKKTGSLWTQWIVFPKGKRYFISMHRIDAVNESEAMFLRIDMPGHIRHQQGNSFERIYLSYEGEITSQAFVENFAPDAKFNYRRDQQRVPERFIRAYQQRDPATGKTGPWLAGMTLDPTVVHEAWCHQRGYVCMIQEIGGQPVKAGESFSAAFIVGYFDSIEEMHQIYDQYKGHRGLKVDLDGWELVASE